MISMARRSGNIRLGVRILLIIIFVYMDLDIKSSMPPLAIVGPVYRLCLQVMLLEILYMTL